MIALAQGADAAAGVFLQYGALGAIALLALFAVRVLFMREARSLDIERAARERLEKQLNDQNVVIQEKIVPALTQATAVMSETLVAQRDRRERGDR